MKRKRRKRVGIQYDKLPRRPEGDEDTDDDQESDAARASWQLIEDDYTNYEGDEERGEDV